MVIKVFIHLEQPWLPLNLAKPQTFVVAGRSQTTHPKTQYIVVNPDNEAGFGKIIPLYSFCISCTSGVRKELTHLGSLGPGIIPVNIIFSSL